MKHLIIGVAVLALFSGLFGCEWPGPDNTVCTTQYAPVCGVNGKTYSNSCEADKAGVDVAYLGECKVEPKGCGARLGQTCSADEYCAYEPGAYCGAADATAICKTRPQVCTADYKPVCGCDGKTYSNSCVAASNGTGVIKSGPCNVSVVGNWSGKNPDAQWEVQFNFSDDGSFSKQDLVAPCPPNAVCVWSGIIFNTGSYKYDSLADQITLSFDTKNDFGGKVTLPKSLSVYTFMSTTLVETLPSGNTITYEQTN